MNSRNNRSLFFALWVILIAMTLAAVFPSVSPFFHTSSNAAFTIEICDPSGTSKTLLVNNHSPDQDSSTHTTAAHCLFCVLSELQASIITLAGILLLGFIVRQTIIMVSCEWQLIIRTLRWRPNRSQAPPLCY